MTEDREREFRALAKAAHDAIDRFTEILASNGAWFEQGLDGAMVKAVAELVDFGERGTQCSICS